MVRNRVLAIAVALGLFLATGVVVGASDDASKNPGKPAATAAKQSTPPQAPAQGMRVFIDPATGKIREPEPEELRQLAPAAPAAALRADSPGAILRGPGNAIGMKIGDSQMVYSVATKNTDGTISFECVTGADNAGKALSNKPNEKRPPDVK